MVSGASYDLVYRYDSVVSIKPTVEVSVAASGYLVFHDAKKKGKTTIQCV